MKMNCGIYKITNIINNKIYIGSSINLYNRKSQHLKLLKYGKHENSYLQNSFNKYGEENFKWEIIEYVEIIDDREKLKEILLNREQFYLDEYKSYDNKIGYNLLAVAGSRLGSKHSEKTLLKLKEYQSTRPKETSIKSGLTQRGKKLTEEHKQKLSRVRKGMKFSDRHKYNLSKSIMESYKTINMVINLTTGKIFKNILEASRYYQINHSNIGRVCRGERKSAGGFVWRFLENSNNNGGNK